MEKRKYREGGNKTVKRKAVGHGKIQRDRKSKLCIQGKLVQLLRKNKRKKGDKNDRTKEK